MGTSTAVISATVTSTPTDSATVETKRLALCEGAPSEAQAVVSSTTFILSLYFLHEVLHRLSL